MSEDKDKVTPYKSNSFAAKEGKTKLAEKKVEKVIHGEAKVKKKSWFGKLREMLISSNDTKSVGSYIIFDILVPSAKKAIYDAVTTGAGMCLGVDSYRRDRSNGGSKVSYQSYYSDRDGRYQSRSNRVLAGYELKEVVVPSRGDAERALDTLQELISRYGEATVSDYYEIVGVTGLYTDNYYGWTNISDAKYRPTPDGWVILLPRPKQLN